MPRVVLPARTPLSTTHLGLKNRAFREKERMSTGPSIKNRSLGQNRTFPHSRSLQIIYKHLEALVGAAKGRGDTDCGNG